MKKKTVTTIAFVLFVVLLICLLPLPTRFVITMDSVEATTTDPSHTENGIILSGWTYNYLFRQDTVKFDEVMIAGMDIPEQNFPVVPMIDNYSDSEFMISTPMYLAEYNSYYPLTIIMSKDWSSCTIELRERSFTGIVHN